MTIAYSAHKPYTSYIDEHSWWSWLTTFKHIYLFSLAKAMIQSCYYNTQQSEAYLFQVIIIKIILYPDALFGEPKMLYLVNLSDCLTSRIILWFMRAILLGIYGIWLYLCQCYGVNISYCNPLHLELSYCKITLY